MVVHLFGATSSPSCCSYALRKTAEDNQESFGEKTIETVRKNFYLDDCLNYLRAKEEAVKLVDELPALLARGGFRLTKWVSNERSVMHRVPLSERASTVDLELARVPDERALGVEWNVEDDSLGFEVSRLKRILEEVSCHLLLQHVYDLLGLAALMVTMAGLEE